MLVLNLLQFMILSNVATQCGTYFNIMQFYVLQVGNAHLESMQRNGGTVIDKMLNVQMVIDTCLSFRSLKHEAPQFSRAFSIHPCSS